MSDFARFSRRRGFPLFGATTDEPLASFGLLVVRLVFGLGMALHGWPKAQNPFGWMGPTGLPAPLQALAALAEFGGGIALILGLFTRLSALGIGITMAVAYFTANRGLPFVAAPGQRSFETLGLYLAVAVALLIAGPGGLSLDRVLFGERRR